MIVKAHPRWNHSPYPKTCDAFDAWGIDPQIVAQDGVSAEGYEVYIMVDGKKTYDEQLNAYRAFVKWEPGQESIYKIYREEGGK